MRKIVAMLLVALLCCALWVVPHAARASDAAGTTFADAGLDAFEALADDFYSRGRWRECDASGCSAQNGDWGTDSATDTLYLRWITRHGRRVRDMMAQLASDPERFPAACSAGASCGYWSDTAAWDAVADMREFDVTHESQALSNAAAALSFIETSAAFSGGACAGVPFQQPRASGSPVKTLETLANEIKAGLLLYQATGASTYLSAARLQYADARRYYYDATDGLYTVHLIDSGSQCVQVPHRYFASVNGLMIWNALELSEDLADASLRAEGIANARAVDDTLSDATGIFVDAGGENDVVEPLVEAMYRLAMQGQSFARSWILRNAGAALAARGEDGSFARFFDGPPQRRTSIWQCNGGASLEIAAAALDPRGFVRVNSPWSGARSTRLRIGMLPATFIVDGSAFALVGRIGAYYAAHHLRVAIDGALTADQTGLWQNPTMPDQDSVFFAWRWKHPGKHTITLTSAGAGGALPAALLLRDLVVSR